MLRLTNNNNDNNPYLQRHLCKEWLRARIHKYEVLKTMSVGCYYARCPHGVSSSCVNEYATRILKKIYIIKHNKRSPLKIIHIQFITEFICGIETACTKTNITLLKAVVTHTTFIANLSIYIWTLHYRRLRYQFLKKDFNQTHSKITDMWK